MNEALCPGATYGETRRRLIDDIRAGRQLGMPRFVPLEGIDKWRAAAERSVPLLMDTGMPIVLADEVSDYYFTDDQERWRYDRDIGSVRPPFEQFWSEYRMPAKIRSAECGDSDLVARGITRGRVGVLVLAADPKNATGDIPKEARWILACELFVDYGRPGMAIQGPHGAVFYALDKHGHIIGDPCMHSFTRIEPLAKGLFEFFKPVLLAITFLNAGYGEKKSGLLYRIRAKLKGKSS